MPPADPARKQASKNGDEIAVDILYPRNVRGRQQQAYGGVLNEIFRFTAIPGQRVGVPKEVGVPLQKKLANGRRLCVGLENAHSWKRRTNPAASYTAARRS